MKIRGDCKSIQPLNYGVNPAETSREVSQRVRGHTFLLFSNWPCHFRLINISLPPANFPPALPPRRRIAFDAIFANVVLAPSFIFRDVAFSQTRIFNEISCPLMKSIRRFLPSLSIVAESFNRRERNNFSHCRRLLRTTMNKFRQAILNLIPII